MKNITLLLLTVFLLFSAFDADKPIITIYMIGDSTMANKDLTGDNPERGWGQMLPDFFAEEVCIDNHAKNGRISKSFIDEGLWDKVISQVKKGDYVFIQFGHNDEKPDPKRHTQAGSTFDDNLRRFVNETRAKGGIPVLFSSIVRRSFDDNSNVLIDTHGKYLDSPRNVANELKVLFIDMNKITHNLVEGLGPEKSKELYMWIPKNTVSLYPRGKEDNTHLNTHGARVIARLTVEAVKKTIPELDRYIQP